MRRTATPITAFSTSVRIANGESIIARLIAKNLRTVFCLSLLLQAEVRVVVRPTVSGAIVAPRCAAPFAPTHVRSQLTEQIA